MIAYPKAAIALSASREKALAPFAGGGGAVRFDMPALIVTVRRAL